MIAAKAGQTQAANPLIANGVHVDAKSHTGWTALMYAVNNGHIDFAKLLMENQTDINVKSNTGWTPLMLAAYNGYLDLVKLFIESQADLSANDGVKKALELAEQRGHEEVVLLLKQFGAK